ncbi:MAG: hypothetical protein Q8N68_01960 [bacterium]|nr:hypothetical protein [bacterium]
MGSIPTVGSSLRIKLFLILKGGDFRMNLTIGIIVAIVVIVVIVWVVKKKGKKGGDDQGAGAGPTMPTPPQQ